MRNDPIVEKAKAGFPIDGWYFVDAKKPLPNSVVATFGANGYISNNAWDGNNWSTGGDRWRWWTYLPCDVTEVR